MSEPETPYVGMPCAAKDRAVGRPRHHGRHDRKSRDSVRAPPWSRLPAHRCAAAKRRPGACCPTSALRPCCRPAPAVSPGPHRRRAREDAAAHGRGRRLRQRVRRVATAQHRRDTRRARLADLGRHGRDRCSRRFIFGIRGEARHRFAERTRGHRACGLEAAERPVVVHHREAIRLQRLHRIRELVDRVVRTRRRAVTTGIAHGQLVRGGYLLRADEAQVLRLAGAFVQLPAAVVAVQRVLRVGQVARCFVARSVVVSMPVSSSPLNAMIRSRVGTKPSRFRRRNVVVSTVTPCLLSSVPRPKK